MSRGVQFCIEVASPWFREEDGVIVVEWPEDEPNHCLTSRALVLGMVERVNAMRAALVTLSQWDMLALNSDGTGAVTSDAGWALGVINAGLDATFDAAAAGVRS